MIYDVLVCIRIRIRIRIYDMPPDGYTIYTNEIDE